MKSLSHEIYSYAVRYSLIRAGTQKIASGTKGRELINEFVDPNRI